MSPIPANLSMTLFLYGPALLALGVAAGIGWGCRGKGKQNWARAGVSLACLAGWAALEPVSRIRGAALSPGLGTGMLLVPAAGVAAIEALLVWRAGRNERWLGFAAAAFVGWWLARIAAVPGEFWRVWIVTGLLVAMVAWVVRQQPMRGLALALALWGGAVLIGFPAGWIVAAAVLAAAWAGLLALGAAAAVPSALVAAVLAGADLARGRAARGHIDGADLVCLCALIAPLVAAAAQNRLGKRAAALAPIVGAAVAVALTWGLRRVVF